MSSKQEEEEDAKKKKDGMKRKPYNNITIEEEPQFPEPLFFFLSPVVSWFILTALRDLFPTRDAFTPR